MPAFPVADLVRLGAIGSKDGNDMRRPLELLRAAELSALFLALSAPAFADTAVVEALKDNTLYEDSSGLLSNGSGEHFFAGKTGQAKIVRGLIEFDFAASIPTGATINTVSLNLFMSRTQNMNVETVSVHRVLAEWGEGGSAAPMGEGGGASAQAEDATWLHAFFASSLWSTAGGDFNAVATASASVGGVGAYVWSSSQLTADVADFLADAAGNHGWVVIGNEAALAKRFDSVQNPSNSQRPRLVIDFDPPTAVPALGSGTITMLVVSLMVGSVAGLRRSRAT